MFYWAKKPITDEKELRRDTELPQFKIIDNNTMVCQTQTKRNRDIKQDDDDEEFERT